MSSRRSRALEAHRLLEVLDAAAAGGLGRVHGEVGVLEQLVGRGLAVDPSHDTDAGPNPHVAAADR